MSFEKSVRIGIIGGLGPKTGFVFTEFINNTFVGKNDFQPDLLLLNLPVPDKVMKAIATGQRSEEMKQLLISAVKRLNQAEVDLIVIPCNSVHIFIEELRKESQKPILSIIEESAKECDKRKIQKVGLLASTNTIQQNLHSKALSKINIQTIIPEAEDQKTVSETIIKIINNHSTNKDKEQLRIIIKKLITKGAENILLACTDLQLILSQQDSDVPLLDTMQILANSTLQILQKETLSAVQ
ncbi:MAG: amino acid racemase [Candidatus Nanoarchaeia archaeon]